MIRNLIVTVLLLSTQLGFAQRYAIKGQLLDSLSGPLPSATVLLLQQKDSTLIKFSVSDGQGNFEIKGVAKGEYIFKVSYLSFATHTQKVSASGEQLEINLGKVKLLPQANQLGEVVVKADKAPVVVKRDTIEFNAGSFKTKTNATVEDLLKKLPGVEVETDGTVKAQGEEVKRVMVDGREFFGQDPKLATRNLPADAVEKVQVFDKKSDQAIFTGIDDGQKEKTINLELKEEKRHGAFGNSMVGVGDNNHYTAKTNINRFNNGNQLSILGMGNNINQQGFGIGDYLNFNGGGGPGGGGGGAVNIQVNGGNAQSGGAQINTGQQNGIVTNYAGGANINQNYNKNKTKLNGSYFYNRLDQNLLTDLQRVNYLQNGNYNFDQTSNQNIANDNHKLNVTVDHKIDSVNSLKFNTSVVYNMSDQHLGSEGKTWNIGNATLKNESNQNTTSKGNGVNVNSNLLFRHRFAKKGRTISTNFIFGYSENEANGTLQSTNIFYKGLPVTSLVNQRSKQTTTSPNYGVTLSYTEPLGGRKYLEFNYNYNADVNKVDKSVYDLKNEQEKFSDSLSNKYNSNYQYNRPGINFRMNREKFNFSVGTAYQNTQLNGNIILKNTTIDRTFEAVLPSAHFNYDYNTFKHLRIDYSTNMQEPSIQQLQPIVNNSDQLNQSIGNPQLRPSYVHQLRSNFMLFNPTSFMNVFALVNGNYTTNAIVNSQTNTDLGVRISQPVNVRYSRSLSGNLSLGIPIKPINSRFNVGPTYNFSQSLNLTNGVESTLDQEVLGGNIRYNYSLNDILIVDLGTTLSHQQSTYSTGNNQSYFNKTYNAEVNVNFLKNYAFNTEMNYFVYTSQTTDFHQAIPLWNVSLSRYILKNKVGELKIGVNNLLNRSQTASQTASTNYLQQQTTNNLGRFFMLSFTYALNKQLNPMGDNGKRGGGRGMRMIINN